MNAPTVEKPTVIRVFGAQNSQMGTPGWERFRARRRRLRAVRAKERAHIDQASQEAVRLLIIPILLVLASYCIKLIIADCCFPCTPGTTS